MPFILRAITLSLHDQESELISRVSRLINCAPQQLQQFRIMRKGIDARHKSNIKFVYTVSFALPSKEANQALREQLPLTAGLEWLDEPQPIKCRTVTSSERFVIVGSGPAGLFAALRLAEYGLSATLIERGQPVEQRAMDVQQFWQTGILQTESNVQFGEGGAGTFSDGKLTCRSKDPHVPWILQRLADFGADPEICYLAKPHIGTDQLRLVITNIRTYLLERGFTLHFNSRLSDITIHQGKIAAITINDSSQIPCDHLIIATGHSARDTYQMLLQRGVPMEQKPFAMGVRVEHPQELINSIQYGSNRSPLLPVADYAVTWNNNSTGRSAYSFCMCPGGVVIAGASETGGVVTNGMSSHQRNSPFANSALVVNVTPRDFGAADPLAGVRFQRHWEQAAFRAGGATYKAPAQNLLSFLKLPGGTTAHSTYRPGLVESSLDEVLPSFISTTLREGIPFFDRKMRGFVTREATLIGIESRTSSPVRLPRNEQFESIGVAQLYPAGEGAGYAGGIMSAAVDGVRIVDSIVARLT